MGISRTEYNRVLQETAKEEMLLNLVRLQYIEPSEHYACGLVETTLDESGQCFDWQQLTGDLVRIRSQKKFPKHAAIAVEHHGPWFYINDADLVSKATLSLLLEVYNLEIRGGGGRQVPVLTIGAGGHRR